MRVLLNIGGNFPRLRAKLTHMVGHLPQGYRLRGWLEEVEQLGEPELQACARHLHKEESAVQAGLTLACSNGPTEGFLHRLTLLKRQAYGRAGVALLKQRMLFHPSNLIAA